MPDKRPGRLPLFSLPLSLGWTAAFCANMGGGLRLCLGMAWPRGGGGGVWRPFGPPNQRAQGPKAPAPFVCASRTRRPPAGPGQCSPTGGRPHRFYQTKQRAAQRVARRRGAGGLANGAHGGAEGHQRQLCQLKVLFPPGDADDGDAPQAAKHKGFDSQGQAADQQPDDVGQ